MMPIWVPGCKRRGVWNKIQTVRSMRYIFIFFLLIFIQKTYCQSEASSFLRLEIDDFYTQLNTKTNKLVLDVRPYKDFEKEHIPESIPIYDKKVLFQLTDSLDKETDLFIYCTENARSLEVCKILQEQGFKHIHMLNGGISEWKKRKFELSRNISTKNNRL